MKKSGITIVVIVLCMLGFVFPFCLDGCVSSGPIKPKPAKEEHATVLLENVALGIKLESIRNGGGGKRNFVKNLEKIKDLVMPEAAAAFPGNNQVPYEGFFLRLEEYPEGDCFKTDFRVIAEPANGFVGKKYMITKSEIVSELK